jgi:hypothetical protein
MVTFRSTRPSAKCDRRGSFARTFPQPKDTIMAARFRLRLVAASLAFLANGADAGTPEQQCQQGRYLAASKYAACQQKADAKLYAGGTSQAFDGAIGKCGAKYTAVWARLAAKATGTGSFCDNPRLANNGDGTVTDRLTGLRWERKTNLDTVVNYADPHDADNTYAWTGGGEGFTAPDGDAYTSFLATLNGACFGTQCDWRLPTLAELQTLLVAPAPCTSTPCIDPVFGPTSPDKHWSATTRATAAGLDAWTLEFNQGFATTQTKIFGWRVRAVRGGL